MDATLPGLFFQSARNHPKKPALLFKRGGVFFPITYRELAGQVEVFAAALKKFGVTGGDALAILSENRPEWVVADLAAMSLGAVTVPLHATYSAKAAATILQHSRAKILVVSNANLLHKALIFPEKLSHLEHVIFLDKLTDTERQTFKGKIFHWNTLMSRAANEVFDLPFLDQDAVCSIIYTSGTTGQPKGVMLTHHNIVSNIEAATRAVPVKEQDVFLSFLPLSHVLERTLGCYAPLIAGATIAFTEHHRRLQKNLREVQPTVLVAVPRAIERFYDAIWDAIDTRPAWQQKLFKRALRQKPGTVGHLLASIFFFRNIRQGLGGRLRVIVSGGASLSENLGKFFLKLGLPIVEGYGLTETSPVVTANSLDGLRFGTVGKPVPGVRVKIGKDKEVLVSGPNVFKGYFRNRKDTREAFDKDGWLRTGDLGFMDAQGFHSIIGRQKEMFVLSGGKNVWPESIENLLNADKYIWQSMAVGRGRKFTAALLVPDWEEVELFMRQQQLPLEAREKMVKHPEIHKLIQERIDQKINPQLSDHEKIKRFRLLAAEFTQANDELTPTLKLRRHVIEKHHQKEIDGLYES